MERMRTVMELCKYLKEEGRSYVVYVLTPFPKEREIRVMTIRDMCYHFSNIQVDSIHQLLKLISTLYKIEKDSYLPSRVILIFNNISNIISMLDDIFYFNAKLTILARASKIGFECYEVADGLLIRQRTTYNELNSLVYGKLEMNWDEALALLDEIVKEKNIMNLLEYSKIVGKIKEGIEKHITVQGKCYVYHFDKHNYGNGKRCSKCGRIASSVEQNDCSIIKYVCPVCGSLMIEGDYGLVEPYCPHCGQFVASYYEAGNYTEDEFVHLCDMLYAEICDVVIPFGDFVKGPFHSGKEMFKILNSGHYDFWRSMHNDYKIKDEKGER